MRPSLLIYACLLCLGCARAVDPTRPPEDAATPTSGTEVSTPTGADSPPVPDAGGTEAGLAAAPECRSDEDCALTLVPEGECCATLCTGRVVTAEKARGLAATERACEERGEPCAIPSCAPPRTRPVPVCTGGRCTARMVPMEAR